MDNQQLNKNMNWREVTIPMNTQGEAAFLLQPELHAYLLFVKEDIEKAILQIEYDVDMPKKQIAAVIAWQGKLALITELLQVHSNKINENPEEN